MPSDRRARIVLIGGGPRGVSLLERIGANLVDAASTDAIALDIHLVDDVEPGAGRIWRTDQTRELCMNTLADAVTLFTDESVTMDGPVRPGPTLFEWCVLALHDRHPTSATAERVAAFDPRHGAVFASTPVRAGLADEYRAELAAMVPESHPSRALYGEYLQWCFARASATPAGVRVTTHRARAVRIRRSGSRDRVVLDTGETLLADAVAAAAGWMPRQRTPAEQAIARAVDAGSDLVWVEQGNPGDQRLDAVPDGADAIVRGLGMGFFDAMALLTVARGGRFVEDAAAGGLRYEPSGREPVLHVTSRRGVPFRAKSLYGSLPPRAPQRHLRSVDWASVSRAIDFDAQVWPLILKDAFADYSDTLARVRPGALDGSLDELQAAITSSDGSVAGLASTMAGFVPDPRDRFDLPGALAPAGAGPWRGPAEFADRVVDYLREDLAEAELGRDSALKAGLWAIGSARKAASRIGAFGGYDAPSRIGGFRRLHSVGGMIGSGPPAFRTRQLLALVDAGLVRFVGPAAEVRVEGDRFVAQSPFVPDSAVAATALIDAWMHPHDLTHTADPLAADLLADGRARAFQAPARNGGAPLVTGGIDIDPATGLLVHPDGALDARVHVAGIPADETQHDTIISPMPGADASMLRETDRVARSLLQIALSSGGGDVAPEAVRAGTAAARA